MRIANEVEAMYGKEPGIDDISEALNWYSAVPSKEEKKQWFLDYLQDIGSDVATASLVPEFYFISAGSIARLWMRGHQTDDFAEKLQAFKSEILAQGKILQSEAQTTADKKAKAKSLLFKKEVSEAAAHIDLLIDSWMEGNKISLDVESWIKNNKISKEVREEIKKKFSKMLLEVEASDSDPEIAEYYSKYSKKQKANLIQVLSDLMTISSVAADKASRKPRKKKEKSPAKIVKNLKFLKDFKDLNLTSIDPEIIVGAKSLWVYNVKYRILTNYVSDTGLTVKGTTLLNINEQESRSKKLRKPEGTVPEVLSAGKVALRKVFENLTTGFLKVNGRINKETILLRVV